MRRDEKFNRAASQITFGMRRAGCVRTGKNLRKHDLARFESRLTAARASPYLAEETDPAATFGDESPTALPVEFTSA